MSRSSFSATSRRLAPLMLAAMLAGTASAQSGVSSRVGNNDPQTIGGSDRGTFIIRNARVFTVSGPVIENGMVLIRDGLIAAVGANVTVPAGAREIDAKGLNVYPGMIDAGTTLGLTEVSGGAAGTVDATELGNFNPSVMAADAINPHSAQVGVTRIVGVTNVVSMPRGGVISGQAAFLNLLGFTPKEMAITPSTALIVNLPGGGGGGRGGRGGRGGGEGAGGGAAAAAQLEELKNMFRDADAYAKAFDAYAKDKSLPRPSHNVRLAALVPVVQGKTPVVFSANSAADITRAIAFAEEMKLKPVIMGGSEAYKVTALLKEKNVPVILTNTLSQPGDDDPYDLMYESASKLQKAGVRFSISTGGSGTSVRDLPWQAGMASAFGLPKDEALKAVTLYPAQVMNMQDKLGSIEVGKMANIVVTDGDLLEARTKTRYLFIDGRQVPLTSKHEDLYDLFRNRGVTIVP
jgi:imidazolonepropionase-like amidohydrolase